MKQMNLLTTALVAMFLFIPTAISAADVADQGTGCPAPGPIGANFMVTRSPDSYQTFTPALNRLSKVSIPVSIEGLVSQNITLKIYQGGTLVTSSTLSGLSPSAGVYTPLTFDFTDIPVTPGATYKMILSTSDTGVAGADWMSTGSNCYAGGTSYGWGAINNYDYSFITYGWDYIAPATAAPSTNSTTKSTTTAAPAATDTQTSTVSPATVVPAASTDTNTTGNNTVKKMTLIESVVAKPIYWIIPLAVILLAAIGFLVFYELKLKNKKNTE